MLIIFLKTLSNNSNMCSGLRITDWGYVNQYWIDIRIIEVIYFMYFSNSKAPQNLRSCSIYSCRCTYGNSSSSKSIVIKFTKRMSH